MRKKLGKKSKLPRSKELAAKAETVPANASLQPEPAASTTVTLAPADPQVLQHLAEKEPDRFALSDYDSVIMTLRRKGFSYREIAEWLSEYGVEVDYNAVYRAYTKNLSAQEAADEAQREEQEAQDEAYRNR